MEKLERHENLAQVNLIQEAPAVIGIGLDTKRKKLLVLFFSSYKFRKIHFTFLDVFLLIWKWMVFQQDDQILMIFFVLKCNLSWVNRLTNIWHNCLMNTTHQYFWISDYWVINFFSKFSSYIRKQKQTKHKIHQVN